MSRDSLRTFTHLGPLLTPLQRCLKGLFTLYSKVSQGKGLRLGLLVSMIGFVLIQAPFGFDIEESYALQWLFWLRGARPPPPNVVIVGIDKQSGQTLRLPKEPDDWPWSIHAELIRKLSGACAQAIVFDLYFAAERSLRSAEENEVLARAIRGAGNIALVSHLALRNDAGSLPIEETHRPAAALQGAAAAVAPFPLPNSPSVTGYWKFKTSAGDMPTIPTVAFQIYALRAYDVFRTLLDATRGAKGLGLPANKDEVLATRGVTDLVERLRDLFQQDTELGERMRTGLHKTSDVRVGPEIKQVVMGLLNLYLGDDWQYLNFYGPPRAVKTVGYNDVLQLSEPINCQMERTYAGKVVFVGVSELSPVDQKDQDVFDTAFTQSNGSKLSGVEIAATATANLIEGSMIRRLSSGASLWIVLGWGLLISIMWRSLATSICIALTLGVIGVYFATAYSQFKLSGLWYPLATPLLQSLVGIVFAVVRNRGEAEARVADIRRVLSDWLPPIAIEQVVTAPGSVQRPRGLLYGTCMHTDLEGFTTLAQSIEPTQLSMIMDRYFKTIGQPVTRRGGFVSDQTGDAMLAIWAGAEPDITLRRQACEGALDIADAVAAIAGERPLPTRIGLHTGRIAVRTIPVGTTGQYRSFGLIVNAAQRIEALNKVLRTRILVSEEVVEDIGADFVMRPVGSFVLTGLVTPLAIYELLGRRRGNDTAASGSTVEHFSARDPAWLCAAFAEALQDYENMKWQAASELFLEILSAYPGDGPSHFYLRRTEYFRHDPPGGVWDPVIRT